MEGLQDHHNHTSTNVLNLSNYTLSREEISILDKGLTFVPTPKISKLPILQAATDFGRRLKIKNYFDSRTFHNFKKVPLSGKSSWTPPDKHIHPELLKCISNFTSDIDKLIPKREKNNCNKAEFAALRTLKSNPDIVIKKADKGSATVIMNKSDYIFEANRQLSNSLHYKKLNSPIYPQTAAKITKILQDLNSKNKDLLTNKQLGYLLPPDNPRPRRLYLLPKIHKDKPSWTLPNMPKGRPIISDVNSESQKVAEFIHYILKPVATIHPSYIKDTHDFLAKVRNVQIPENSLLITLDVESMYTNIDHISGIQAVQDAFKSCLHNPQVKMMLDLLEISLTCNDFEFNNQFYLQTYGTSMGKLFAPVFSDIFMAKFEREALSKCPLKPHTFLRYLDDIFIIWPHSAADFQHFFNIFNSHKSSIKFKSTVSDCSAIFLDTVIFKNPSVKSQLLSKVYFKPTDTHQLLHKDSFHPKHTFSGIVKSQITRFYRLCSNASDFEAAWQILYQALSKRSYSKRWLRKLKIETLQKLKHKIVPYPIPTPSTRKTGFFSCKTIRCLTCPIITDCHNFDSFVTEFNYPITTYLDCSTTNLIYLYTCLHCSKQYVGETGNSLRDRTNRHRSDLKRQVMSNSLTKHLLQTHFVGLDSSIQLQIEDEFLLTAIEKLDDQETPTLTKLHRLTRESFWIKTLMTFQPFGLNEIAYKPKIKDSKSDSIPFVTQYSNTGSLAAKIIKKHLNNLKTHSVFDDDLNIITAFSKHKNISEFVVRSKLDNIN